MTPREIVQELDKHIIGQSAAKRAVAIALRNRWRRMQVGEPLRAEITPKNILMIGPTGVGKTEIARRLARLANAPFIKVEATKFTEVGYVGREVDSIIKDLVDVAVKMTREQEMEKVRHRAMDAAEERVLDELLPRPRARPAGDGFRRAGGRAGRRRKRTTPASASARCCAKASSTSARSKSSCARAAPAWKSWRRQAWKNCRSNCRACSPTSAATARSRAELKVSEAFKLLTDEEAAKLLDEEELKTQALRNAEQNGIVFLDEIDKIARGQNAVSGVDVSREGVQRDLLPLVEGSTVNTKYGMVKTDHILFIASGAFHMSKPSDLIPELQGRLPIRVELDALKVEDFVRILTEPDASLCTQYGALLSTEGVTLKFDASGVRRIAEVAFDVNQRTENIGARRLHTVMERLLEAISFEASDRFGTELVIDGAYVDSSLGKLAQDEDLARYIL